MAEKAKYHKNYKMLKYQQLQLECSEGAESFDT